MKGRLLVIGLLLLALVVGGGVGVWWGRSGSADGPRLTLLAGQTEGKVGAVFEFASFKVTVGYAVYDAQTQRLYVGTRWQNLDTKYQPTGRPVALQMPGQSASNVLEELDSPKIPPGRAADITYMATDVGQSPLHTGMLVFGATSERQVTVSLANGKGDNQALPRPVPVDHWMQIGAHTVRITGGELESGDIADNRQGAPNTRTLRLNLDTWTSTPRATGFSPCDYLRLQLPDGTVEPPSRTNDGVPEDVWSFLPGGWADFTVPDKAAGTYELRLMRRNPGLLGVSCSDIDNNTYDSMKVTIPASATQLATPADLPSGDLPVPVVAPRSSTGNTAVGASIVQALTLQPLSVPGGILTLTHVTWDPSAKTVKLTGSLTALDQQPGAPPASRAGSITVPTALQFGTRMASADVYASGFDQSATQQVSAEYDEVDGFDLSAATLFVGTDSGLPLGAKSSAPAIVPTWMKTDGTQVVAGAFTVKMTDYRIGQVSGARLDPGFTEVELGFDVTTSNGDDEHTNSFNPQSQLLLYRSDGFVQRGTTSVGGDVTLATGKPVRMSVTFVVPTGDLTNLQLALRSRDPGGFPAPAGWVLTTFTVKLTGMQ